MPCSPSAQASWVTVRLALLSPAKVFLPACASRWCSSRSVWPLGPSDLQAPGAAAAPGLLLHFSIGDTTRDRACPASHSYGDGTESCWAKCLAVFTPCPELYSANPPPNSPSSQPDSILDLKSSCHVEHKLAAVPPHTIQLHLRAVPRCHGRRSAGNWQQSVLAAREDAC